MSHPIRSSPLVDLNGEEHERAGKELLIAGKDLLHLTCLDVWQGHCLRR